MLSLKNAIYTDEDGEAHSAVVASIGEDGKAQIICQLNGELRTLNDIPKGNKGKPNTYKLT